MVDGLDKTFFPALQILVGMLCLLTLGAISWRRVVTGGRPLEAMREVLSGLSRLAAATRPAVPFGGPARVLPTAVRALPPPSAANDIGSKRCPHSFERDRARLF